jgi:hypothetical protein
MHRHEHERVDDEAAARPARYTGQQQDAMLFRAAAAGRADVLGSAGMLRVQRSAGNGAASGLVEEERSPVLDVVSSGGGRALDEPVRNDMEGRLGADFSDVRVHTDSAADSSAKSVQAHAYTVGSNIVFQRDRYDPGSSAGQTLLAHELTHVVQQRSGPVDGTSTGGGVQVSDPSDRYEQAAAANAARVMSQPAQAAPVQREAATAGAAVVQREAAPEEEEVQASHDPSVQREGEEEEEQTS